MNVGKGTKWLKIIIIVRGHDSTLEGSDPHELAGKFEACQMKVAHIEASELTLFKSYEIGLLRI